MVDDTRDDNGDDGVGAEGLRLSRRDILVKGSALGLSVSALGGLSGVVAGRGLGAVSLKGASPLKGKKAIVHALGLQFEFQVGLYNTLKKNLQSLGMSVTVLDGKADANLQASQVETAIVQKPDYLIVNPADPKLLAPAIRKAATAKIPVFIFENPPPTGWIGLVTFGDEKAGRLAADAMNKLLKGKGGHVLECRGGIGSTQAALRLKGFHEQVKAKYPNIKIRTLKTEWTADNAFTLVSDAITADPTVLGVWSHNDEMVKGVVSALQKLGKLKKPREPGHIFVIGLDATPLALDRIRKGTEDASMGQNPFEMASLMVKALTLHAQGKPVPKKQLVNPQVVTRANVNNPKLWGNVFKK
jgi:ribose transport system substrate-binding protein